MGGCTSIERRAAEAKIRHRCHHRQTRKGATLGLKGGFTRSFSRSLYLSSLACKKHDIARRQRPRASTASLAQPTAVAYFLSFSHPYFSSRRVFLVYDVQNTYYLDRQIKRNKISIRRSFILHLDLFFTDAWIMHETQIQFQ